MTRATRLRSVPARGRARPHSTAGRGRCLLCGRRGRWGEVLSDRLRDEPAGRFRVVRCGGCEHAQLSPLPSAREDRAFYAADRQTKNIMGSVQVDLERRKAGADTRRRLALLTRTCAPGSARVLDVGSGYGFFVDAAVVAGYDAVGLDPSDERIAQARTGCRGTLLHGVLNAAFAKRWAGAFGWVLMSHVVEHVADPVGCLRLARRLLAPGGALVVEAPNLDDALLAEAPAYRAFYWQRAHLSYFDPAGLSSAFRRAGWATVRMRGVQRYGLRNLLHWLDQARPQLERPEYETAEPLLQGLEARYKAGRERALTCDTLIAVAQVPGRRGRALRVRRR